MICSIAATSVTNESLMLQGFQRYARTSHLNVSYERYGDYSHAISQYIDGKTDGIQVKNPESGQMEDAFSEKENLHLRDVRGIVRLLKIMRYAGGAVVIAGVLLAVFRKKK